MSARLALALSLALAALLGCGAPAGAPCRSSGAGFSLRDPCRTRCLDLWTVTCPDGRTVRPPVCAGAAGCIPGQCPAGQACYHFDDPFEVRAYCLPVDVCPGAPAGPALAAWERASELRAAEARERYVPPAGRQDGR